MPRPTLLIWLAVLTEFALFSHRHGLHLHKVGGTYFPLPSPPLLDFGINNENIFLKDFKFFYVFSYFIIFILKDVISPN